MKKLLSRLWRKPDLTDMSREMISCLAHAKDQAEAVALARTFLEAARSGKTKLFKP
jgi:hypothetical protein